MNTQGFIDLVTNSNPHDERLEIHYTDGLVVKGWVQKINPNFKPPFVNFCKETEFRGENSDHTVDFENIEKLLVSPIMGGESKTYTRQ